MPFFFEAAILSRIRSPVTSRSNWAKDNSTLRVSRPIELVVLNCWVTDTNDTPCASKISTSRAKMAGCACQLVDLLHDDNADPASPDVGEQALQCGPLHVAAREPAIIVTGLAQYPALVALTADVGLAGLALRLERVELLFEPCLGGFAGVDGAALAARVTLRHGCPPSARRPEAALAMTGGWPIGFVSVRRTAALTTPCR